MVDDNVIRVLFADDNNTKVDGVTRLIHFEPDIRIVGSAVSLAETLEMYQSLEPDVVLMDPALPDTNGFQATLTLRDQDPLAQVVMLAMDATKDGVRQAMRVGAFDFVDNYIQDDKLAQVIREAAQERQRMKKATGQLPPLEQVLAESNGPEGRVIAVFSPKGGVGVTTIAVNLALALHDEQSPVALVDGDLQFGDVCAFLNLQPRYSLADLAAQAEALDDELIAEMALQHESGISVVPAPLSPEQADDVTGEGLVEVLASLRRRYAYVVVDMASYLNEVSLAILEHADLVLSVLVPEIPSIKNARLLLDLFYKLELPRERLIFVMNQMDRRESISVERVADNLKHPVVGELPFDRAAVKTAINKGRPLLGEERSNELYQPLMALVGEVKEKLLEVEEAVTEA
jgi:pilus assembly protein CpaE